MEENIAKITIYTATILSVSTMLFEIMKLLQSYGFKWIPIAIITIYIISSALGFIYGVLIDAMPIIVADSLAFLTGISQLIKRIKGKGG